MLDHPWRRDRVWFRPYVKSRIHRWSQKPRQGWQTFRPEIPTPLSRVERLCLFLSIIFLPSRLLAKISGIVPRFWPRAVFILSLSSPLPVWYFTRNAKPFSSLSIYSYFVVASFRPRGSFEFSFDKTNEKLWKKRAGVYVRRRSGCVREKGVERESTGGRVSRSRAKAFFKECSIIRTRKSERSSSIRWDNRILTSRPPFIFPQTIPASPSSLVSRLNTHLSIISGRVHIFIYLHNASFCCAAISFQRAFILHFRVYIYELWNDSTRLRFRVNR